MKISSDSINRRKEIQKEKTSSLRFKSDTVLVNLENRLFIFHCPIVVFVVEEKNNVIPPPLT